MSASPSETSAAQLRRNAILTQLDDVRTLLNQDRPDGLHAAAALVAEILDRLNVLTLTEVSDNNEDGPRATDTPSAAGGACCTVLAGRHAEPVDAWLLIPFGDVRVEHPVAGRDFTFTREHAEAVIAWFERLGRALAIDYEHQSFEALNGRSDGLRPAAGWIGRLEIRTDGLWATDVSWTPKARELLATHEYRYFSPVIYWADETCAAIAALGPVALTNDPAMVGVPSLAAARADLRQSRGEIDRLKRELRAREADTFVERGLRAGKIVAATSLDWHNDYLHDPEQTTLRLARAPVIVQPGRIASPAPLPAEDTRIARTRLSFAGASAATAFIDDADLAAFERAERAGRVRTP